MNKKQKFIFRNILVLMALEAWFRDHVVARFVAWILFLSPVNNLCLPLVRRWVDPEPGFWLQVIVFICMNAIIINLWDAAHGWFWQRIEGWLLKVQQQVGDKTEQLSQSNP